MTTDPTIDRLAAEIFMRLVTTLRDDDESTPTLEVCATDAFEAAQVFDAEWARRQLTEATSAGRCAVKGCFAAVLADTEDWPAPLCDAHAPKGVTK